MGNPLAFVVEDSEELATIYVIALEEAGFTVEVCHDGQQALDRLTEIIPDVILLDLHLPNVSGDRIANTIIADNRLENARVIVASADARMAESLRDKVELVFIKPVSMVQLRELAARLNPQHQ